MNNQSIVQFAPGASNDAKPMVPHTGSVTAQPEPGIVELNSANVNASSIGWYIKNEHAGRTIRIGDASLTDTTGFPVGPLETFWIASSKLEDHYVVSPDGPATVTVWGQS